MAENGTIEERVIRVDERTKIILDKLDTFVTKDEFAPVKNVVYGSVTAVGLVVIGAILALVVQ